MLHSLRHQCDPTGVLIALGDVPLNLQPLEDVLCHIRVLVREEVEDLEKRVSVGGFIHFRKHTCGVGHG